MTSPPEPEVAALQPVVKPERFPRAMVFGIVLLCLLPFLLNLAGVNFSTRHSSDDIAIQSVSYFQLFSLPVLEGGYVFVLWEWTAFCVALFTVIFSFAHFRVTRDTTTPIIGTALFFSAMIDVFRVLTFTGIINSAVDPNNFIPFTWVISRTFNVCLLVAGCLPFLSGQSISRYQHDERGFRFILLTGFLFGLMAYAIIHVCAVLPQLPQTMFPNQTFPRPWDAMPLVLYLFAGGIVFPRFHKAHPSLFSHGLVLSVIPHVACQIHAALWSSQLFDNDFNISLYLKTIAYLVPLAGLILDYIWAYAAEVTLRTTQAKLRVAREVQQGLLPKSSPQLDLFDIAGISIAADAAGGDYFDYVPMDNDGIGIVIADVSGHEIGASILMAETRAYLRATAMHETDVGAIATKVNHFLVADVQGRWFVTMFFARLDTKTGSIKYAACGHDAYIFRANGDLYNLESTSPPLCVLEEEDVACGPEETLAAGDILLMYTDGLVEAHSPEREQFGFDRVRKILLEDQNITAEEIVQKLHEELVEHQQSPLFDDDLTIVVVKRKI
ncbi:serine phosphatase [hydrothermal vent metagenome]|uniref:Serine phosphatase n=1 Tax=hydrothermal vent metagenome TaxID=652676 RepID=A0A3B1D8G5_9ZZZZ